MRAFYLIAVGLMAATSAFGQASAPASTRSHVERFSRPEDLAERTETEATAKLTANPNDAETLNTRALARMRLGSYQEAHNDLRHAVTLQPGNADYHANFGYVLWKLGRFGEAVEAERAALILNDKNFTAHYQLRRFLLLGGDPQNLSDAALHLRRALEIDPRRSDIRFDLLTAYRAAGDAPRAIVQLQLLKDARPSDARVIYAEGLLASDRGDVDAAIKSFREALRQDATLSGARQDLGLAYVKLNRWSEAVETFAELAKQQADVVEPAYFHALALYNAGLTGDAEREARRALRIDAGAAAAHTLLGIILATRGARADALEVLSQAAALDPSSFDAQFYTGRLYYSERDYPAAVRALRAAVNLQARHAEARFFLGTVLEAAGESESALTEYRELVALAPDSAMGQTGLGALLVKQGRTEEAIAALQRAIRLDAQSFEAQWALGRALALAGRYDKAINSLQAATTLAPDRPDARYQLGLALRRVGRTEEAAREFAQVERLNAEFRARTSAAKP